MSPVTVFVYGTLLRDELLRAVTGREHASLPAALANHARLRIWGAPYPGLVPARGQSTAGRLIEGVGERALAELDRFEGELYVRRQVITRAESGAARRAHTYLVAPAHWHRLRREPWPEDLARAAASSLLPLARR